MENIIQSYLSKFYEIKISNVGNDGIYLIDKVKIPIIPKYWGINVAPFAWGKLIKELIVIFSLDEVTLTRIVDKWAINQKKDVDLTFYKKEPEHLLPIAQKLAAQTIGLDLVPVTPMNGPKGNIFYFD